MRTRVGPWAGSKDHTVDGEAAQESLDVAPEVQALGTTSDEYHPVKGLGFVSARVMPHDIEDRAWTRLREDVWKRRGWDSPSTKTRSQEI